MSGAPAAAKDKKPLLFFIPEDYIEIRERDF